MNSLSFLLYFIGMVDAIRTALYFGIAVGVVIVVAHLIWYGTSVEYVDKKDIIMEKRAFHYPWIKRGVSVFFARLLGLAIVPTERTVTLIAASEIGEKIISNPAVKDAGREISGQVLGPSIDLLNSYIVLQAQKFKEETKKVTGDKK